MYRNQAGQKVRVFAFNITTNLPIEGDAANITATIVKDGSFPGSATNDVNPTEHENGYYYFDLTQEETNAHSIDVFPVSISTNVHVISGPTIYTVPTNEYVSIVPSVVVEDIESSDIQLYKNADWDFSISGIGQIASQFYFTMKRHSGLGDGESVIQLNLSGMTYLNSEAQSNTSGILTYSADNGGTIAVSVNPTVSSQIRAGNKYVWDIKALDATIDYRAFGSLFVKEPVTQRIE